MDINVHEDTNEDARPRKLEGEEEVAPLKRILDDLVAIREELREGASGSAPVDNSGVQGATERKVMTVRSWQKLYKADEDAAETVVAEGGS